MSHVLEFGERRAVAIYAANGMMKTSLANTFRDIQNGEKTRDRIFAGRETIREVKDDKGNDLDPDRVVVIPPYSEEFGPNEHTSTLLVNGALRKEYEALHVELEAARVAFVGALQKQSGSKRAIEETIASTFTKTSDGFYRALVRVKEEVAAMTDAPFAGIPYDDLFADKVVGFLESPDIRAAIANYITTLNNLLDQSPYFSREAFSYYDAGMLSKQLVKHGFFKAEHELVLKGETNQTIGSDQALLDLVKAEKEKVLTSKDVSKAFDDVDKKINANEDLREFKQFLDENEWILPHLKNVDELRELVWKSYIFAHKELYLILLTKYDASEKRRREIQEAARAEKSQWLRVLEIFRRRFTVPFEVSAKNYVDVVLGTTDLLELDFVFVDGADKAAIRKDDLLGLLSQGEKRAFYILNVIFEVEARRKDGRETLFVFDDIADSFDYKNKYAIVEYLTDIAEHDKFRLIILTHNFDFFRTVHGHVVSRKNCLTAHNDGTQIRLRETDGLNNLFLYVLKPHLFDSAVHRLAAIPFVRNLVEYTRGEEHPEYQTLTALLHLKPNTASITQGELDKIFAAVLPVKGKWSDQKASVIELVKSQALACLTAPAGMNLENKLVLAIAIRLAADEYMIGRINDPARTNAVTHNQTRKLLEMFKKKFAKETEELGVLERVALMTPDHLHLNQFMYEPLVDMADTHLRQLYRDLLALNAGPAERAKSK